MQSNQETIQNGYKNGTCKKCNRILRESCIKNKKNTCGRKNCQNTQNQPESISVSQILLNYNAQIQKEALLCFDISEQTETTIFGNYSQEFDVMLNTLQYQKIGVKIHKYFEMQFQGHQIEDDYLTKKLGAQFISEVQQWINQIKFKSLSIEININDRNVFGKPDLIANSHLYDYKFYNCMNQGKIEKCKTQLLLYVMILATYNKFIDTISIVDLKRGKLITWNILNLKIIKIKQFLKQYSGKQTQQLDIDIHMLLQEMINQCADICRLDNRIKILEILKYIQTNLNILGIESKILYGNCELEPKNHHWIYIDSAHYDIQQYMQITQITEYDMLQDIRNFDMDYEMNNQTENLTNQKIIQICDKYCKKIKYNIQEEGKFKKSVQESKLDNKSKKMLVDYVQEQTDFQIQFEKTFRKQYIQKFGSLNLNQQQQMIELSQNAYRYSQHIQLVIDFFKQPPEEIIEIIQQNSFRGQLEFRKFCDKMLQFYIDRIEAVDQQHSQLEKNILWNSVCNLLNDVEILEKFKICERFQNKYKQYMEQFKDETGCELCHNKKYLITRCCKRKMCYECDCKHLTSDPCPICGSNLSSYLLAQALSTEKVQNLLKMGKQKEAEDYVQYLVTIGLEVQLQNNKIKKAFKYYDMCMGDRDMQTDRGNPIPDPHQWILDKEWLKPAWERYKKQPDMIKNTYSDYMEYMCCNY